MAHSWLPGCQRTIDTDISAILEILNIPLDLFLGFGIGLSLGLIGGGGSILTVPVLVYLVGQSPQTAVTTSLAIVGANSLAGAYFHQVNHNLNWRVAFMFGGSGMLAAYLAAGLSASISPILLLVLFAVLMTLVGLRMVFAKETATCKITQPRNLWVILAAGVGVGLLTGLLGVGGGFVIVPALVIVVGLPMAQAVGTSLVIIALNSLAGFAGHLQSGACNIPVLIIFAIAGTVGVFVGAKLGSKLPAQILRFCFAILVLILAGYLFWDNLPKLFI